MRLSIWLTTVYLCLMVPVIFQSVSADIGVSDSVRKTSVDYLYDLNVLLNNANLSEEFRQNYDYTKSLLNKFLDAKESLLDGIRYYLFTRDNMYRDYMLGYTSQSLKDSPFNSLRKTIFLIHGYSADLPPSSVFFSLKQELLREGDYNIILVDWTQYNKGFYQKVFSITPFIGWKIAGLLTIIMENTGISAESVHMIGHSLGAQIAAHVGKSIPNLGRISGLDAAGPGFQQLPSRFHLYHTDAIFVDSIHTNGEKDLTVGHGAYGPYADIDFFPNGGSIQPGCNNNEYLDSGGRDRCADTVDKKISCNHNRAAYLYLASINTCNFTSIYCFVRGKCSTSPSVIAEMGYHAVPDPALPPQSMFYLKTSAVYPYCGSHKEDSETGIKCGIKKNEKSTESS